MANIENIRHSLAHLLAAAVLKKFPTAKLGIGPVIENGFYYDFLLPRALTLTDLKEFEKTIKTLIAKKLPFKSQTISVIQAQEIFKDQPFKLELIKEFAAQEKKLTVYFTGDVFFDLCEGGHVKNTKEINAAAFRLDKIAGAYWRGNEKNPQLQRIYGLAFNTKKELEQFLYLREEAEKRDHKRLGRELELFMFSPLVGPGLPLFLPKGTIIRTELENYIIEEKQKLGYQFVTIPHLAKPELYQKSGHFGKYDAMMPVMRDKDGNEFVLKAMNCPHHFEIFNSKRRSYKELPLRLASTTMVYRNEKSGELAGLTRVISLTQDDTHHFVRSNQIQSEIEMILKLTQKVFNVFGFNKYRLRISVRDLRHPEKYFGNNSLWEKAEKILISAVQKWNQPYVIKEGEAAFYGPKIDIMVNDSLNREWQLTTIQLDFNQPDNFNMTYIDEKGKKQRPAVLHAAIFGSVERFMGILIEHYAGAFPLWLAPVQVRVIAVSEKQTKYAEKILTELRKKNIRADIASFEETLGKNIRQAELEKIPYLIIVGAKEEQTGLINVRERQTQKQQEISLNNFLKRLAREIKKHK